MFQGILIVCVYFCTFTVDFLATLCNLTICIVGNSYNFGCTVYKSRIGLVVESDVFADFRKLDKEQYRSVIRFLFLEGKSRSEIKERLDAVYGDSFPSMATVKNWFNEFQSGRTSVFDEPCPGAPKTATTEDNVTKIHDLVLADRRL